MSKVNLDTIKPWITQRVTQLLGVEDDVVVEFIFNMLEKKQVRGHSLAFTPPLSLLSLLWSPFPLFCLPSIFSFSILPCASFLILVNCK